jgi:hypothetical protein
LNGERIGIQTPVTILRGVELLEKTAVPSELG